MSKGTLVLVLFSTFPELLGALSDHSGLCATLPWSLARDATAAQGQRITYRWIEGTRLTEYSCSWRAWESYTDKPDFAAQLTEIVDAPHANVDALAQAVE